ncbi:MAG: hypothetical protein JWN46_3611 [Acidimicrobiales bacterium]|nr:hypothetical protein [Acidimicrobiales bacterium]
MRTFPLRRALGVATLVLASTVAVAPAASAHSAAPRCGRSWDSLPKMNPGMSSGLIIDEQVSQERCYDRLTFVVYGRVAGYSAQYTDRVNYAGTPFAMPLRGAAIIHLRVASSVLPRLAFVGDELQPVVGFRTFRQLRYAGSAGGVADYGIGLRSELPFRVLLVPGGVVSYLVLDVGHS